MTEDKTVARALLARAVATEPALDLDPRVLARVGRRRVARRRGALIGGVAVAVGAAVLGTSMLAAPSRVQELPVGASGPALPPPMTLPVPATTHDERSQRLTGAFAVARLIPAGMTVELLPTTQDKPLVFFRAASNNYQMSAQLRDSRGYGRLVVNMDATMPVTDVLNCGAVVGGSCTERTFPDGSRARVSVVPGAISVPGSTMLRLTVSRPNGSFLEAYTDNIGGLAAPGSQKPPSRDEPPLTVEQLFQIAATPSITY
jgi:hypothetical protein